MKNTIKLFALVFVMSFYFTGCYTVVWNPNEEFPDTENSSESSSDFYDYDYYGGYVDYYQSPWWVSAPVYITLPDGTTEKRITKDRTNGNNTRNSDTESIRNSSGRGNTDRNSGTTTGITTPTTTTNSGSGTNSNVVTPPPPTRNTDSGTSTTNSSGSTSNTRDSGSNETRNSSGSRNSGSGRK